MKVKFGIGRSRSYSGHKQLFITPCLGLVVCRSFPDDWTLKKSIVVNMSWLLWGAYIAISKTVREEKQDD